MKSNKLSLISAVISAAVVLGVGGAARAQGRDSCSVRVRQDERQVQQAINRYGYNSQQAQHERAELQRDAQNCGYGYYGTRNDTDGDSDDGRYRNGDRDRYDQHYNGRYNPAFDNGYRDGVAMGQRDSQKGKSFRPEKNDQYEDADRGYNRGYGDKNLYKSQYRQAFERGYADGYGRWR